MRQILHLYIILCAGLCLMAGCTGNGSGNVTAADSLYQWENVRQYSVEEPELALRMIDTAEMRGVMDVNEANFRRSYIYHSCEKIKDQEKSKDYCMMVLNSTADSTQYINALNLLVANLRLDRESYPEAIRYAMEGAQRAHHAGDVKNEANFYYEIGYIMEDTQYGSGMKYIDRSLDILREASHDNWKSLPLLEGNLGNTARKLAEQGNNARAIEILKERLQILNRIDKEATNAPIGYSDERRALTYCVLAYCQWAVGHLTEAKQTAEAFERIKDKLSPNYQMDMMNYYAYSGDGARVQQYYDHLEPIIHEEFDTISARYKDLLNMYAIGLYHSGRYKEAYETLDRHNTLNDSVTQREHQQETLMYAQQFRTQEKEMQLKDEEAKTTIYRIISVSAILIILLITYLLWRSYKYNKVLTEKNRRLLAEIELREQEQQQVIEKLEATPEAELTTEQQLYRRLCQLMDTPDRIYTDADLDRSRLAQLLGTNEHYVSDAISACNEGKSTTDFINGYRLRYATHLLSTTNDSGALIAELCGLSRRTFYRLFNETYSMSPADYRKAAKK